MFHRHTSPCFPELMGEKQNAFTNINHVRRTKKVKIKKRLYGDKK